MPSFLTRITQFMKKYGLTYAQAGALLGVSGKYVGMLARGEKEIDDNSTLSKLLGTYEEDGPPGYQESLSASEEVTVSNDARFTLLSARQKLGLSARDVSRLTGGKLTASKIQAIEEGMQGASETQIEELAKALKIDKKILMSGSESAIIQDVMRATFGTKVPKNIVLPPGITKAKYTPAIGKTAAGDLEDFSDAYEQEGLLTFNVTDPLAITIEVDGDSMEPKYSEGDFVTVYPGKSPRNEKLVVACLRPEFGGYKLFKIYSLSEDGKTVTLSSYNKDLYPPRQYPAEKFQWIYPVASVARLFSVT